MSASGIEGDVFVAIGQDSRVIVPKSASGMPDILLSLIRRGDCRA